ncbi:alpha/beta fold hydrolase [Plantibacter flavus]|uniref:alpha/beta fold hydrolase n=1 Tax=Plantibacter flavus TaxID=150123 RepID=UPI003391C896
MLHGLAGSSREFLPTARALAGRSVVLIDQRGHGESTRRPMDTSRAAYVSDVARVIESETSEPVIVIGQSMGAHTAMLLAAGRPDLVRALVMLEGDQGSGTVEEHRALGHFFRSWNVPFASRSEAAAELGDGPLERAWVEDLEETADGLVPRFDADVMQATIEAVGEPRWHEWESIDVPTLVVYADGGMFTECQKSAFVSQGRRVRRVDLSGASHDAHLDAHEQWAEALRTFIDAQ